MNSDWKNFLSSKQALSESNADMAFAAPEHESNQYIYAIDHLGVLAVAGTDAAKFLQGQITCNINDVTDGLSSLGAMCNPKGRAIGTFLLVKDADRYLMVLPIELLEVIKKKLQMYVLRSKVVLTDCSDELCLIGLSGHEQADEAFLATSRQQENDVIVNLQNRRLAITTPENAIAFWTNYVERGGRPADSAQWRYLDIVSGIPWLTIETSEEFIPQMLNLDKLGGISFNKGCYTGQEIVARTHYLGKAKREMFVAEAGDITPPAPNTGVIDDSSGDEQSIGKVLCAENRHKACKLLIVLQVSETNSYSLRLMNDNRDKITLQTI